MYTFYLINIKVPTNIYHKVNNSTYCDLNSYLKQFNEQICSTYAHVLLKFDNLFFIFMFKV